MKDTTIIGMQYTDAEGEWEVVGFENGMCEVECIQEDHPNEGKRFMVDPDEVMLGYYGMDQIVDYMDDEIREDVHNYMAPCSDLEFIKEYSKRHLEKHGEEFTIG